MIKNNSEKIREIFKELNSNTKKSKNTTELKIDSSLETNNPIVVKGLSAIILLGVEKRASDIHNRTSKKTELEFVYQIDGLLL